MSIDEKYYRDVVQFAQKMERGKGMDFIMLLIRNAYAKGKQAGIAETHEIVNATLLATANKGPK